MLLQLNCIFPIRVFERRLSLQAYNHSFVYFLSPTLMYPGPKQAFGTRCNGKNLRHYEAASLGVTESRPEIAAIALKKPSAYKYIKLDFDTRLSHCVEVRRRLKAVQGGRENPYRLFLFVTVQLSSRPPKHSSSFAHWYRQWSFSAHCRCSRAPAQFQRYFYSCRLSQTLSPPLRRQAYSCLPA